MKKSIFATGAAWGVFANLTTGGANAALPLAQAKDPTE
jgi:hypothetical protein